MLTREEKMIELRRIFYVDDNPRDTELALTALKKNNLANDVVTAEDGEDALDYLYLRGKYANRAPGNPAVMLLDLKMPRVDGLEVLRQVKSDPQLRSIPVVVMTSSREEQDLIRSYELGVNAYVVKPLSFSEFLEAIKQIGAFWGVINEPPPGTAHN